MGLEPDDSFVDNIMHSIEHPEEFEVRLHQNEDMREMLEVGYRAGLRLSQRAWRMGISREPRFVTSDHPLVSWTFESEHSGLMGLGTDNAEQFFFALDPRHVLILVLPANLTEAVFPLGDWFVGLINRVIVAFSYKYVYQHPEHRLISGLIRKEPRDIAPKDQMEALMQPYVEAALQDLDAQRQPSKGEI